jgi:phage gp36-like protein
VADTVIRLRSPLTDLSAYRLWLRPAAGGDVANDVAGDVFSLVDADDPYFFETTVDEALVGDYSWVVSAGETTTAIFGPGVVALADDVGPYELTEDVTVNVSVVLSGPGSDQITIYVTDGSDEIPEAAVWVTSDELGSNVIAGPIYTSDQGEADFLLTDGDDYYVWIRKAGYNPIVGELYTATTNVPASTFVLTLATPVSVYCTRTDIENIYGASNVSKWADIDNEEDESVISDRIDWAIEASFDEFNDALRDGKYLVPLSAVPTSVVRYSAVLAGVWLYDGRGIIDMTDSQQKRYEHKLMYMRKRVECYLQNVRSGRVKLDLDHEVDRIVPEVIID